MFAAGAFEGILSIWWNQDGVVDQFIIYWKTKNGPEYNISTGNNVTRFAIRDDRIMSATYYYISVVAVAGEETSNRSDTERAKTGKVLL